MSIYSEHECGSLTDFEFECACNQMNLADEDYERRMRRKYAETEEGEMDEENN